MADLKISQLTDGSPIQLSDQIPINRGGSNFRVSPGFTIDATNIFALRNSTTTQTLRVYRTESSSLTNYERTALQFSTYSTVNYARLSVESAGTGSANMPIVVSPKGSGAFIVGVMPDGSTGGNARGSYAIDIQLYRGFPSSVASGSQSVTIGDSNTASGTGSVAIGQENNCSGGRAVILGFQTSVSGFGASAVGYGCSVSASYSFASGNGSQTGSQAYGGVAMGVYAYARDYAQISFGTGDGAFGSGQLNTQSSIATQYGTTTNATTTEIGSGGSTSNRLTVPSGSVRACRVAIVARSSTGDVAMFMRMFAIQNTGGTTALVGSVQTVGTDIGSNAGSPPAGWAVSITANDTNDAIKLEVTGAAATTIKWAARYDIIETRNV